MEVIACPDAEQAIALTARLLAQRVRNKPNSALV